MTHIHTPKGKGSWELCW